MLLWRRQHSFVEVADIMQREYAIKCLSLSLFHVPESTIYLYVCMYILYIERERDVNIDLDTDRYVIVWATFVQNKYAFSHGM